MYLEMKSKMLDKAASECLLTLKTANVKLAADVSVGVCVCGRGTSLKEG